MDVRNAAYGLNLPSASRIYFVNPTCRPNIEAQAIKRAHRIGQTRPVYVETLVLQGTIEEKMLERSKRMTRSEHRDAGHLEDDIGIREIIQSARMIPVLDEGKTGRGQMAPLQSSQQLWAREGYRAFLSKNPAVHEPIRNKRKRQDGAEEPGIGVDLDEREESGQPMVRRTLAFVDCRRPHSTSASGNPEQNVTSNDEPIAKRYKPVPSSSRHPLPPSHIRDPFLPLMTGDRLEPINTPPPATTLQQDSGADSEYRRLSISELLNVPRSMTPQVDNERQTLVQSILRLL
jgi:hypothetical protein